MRRKPRSPLIGKLAGHLAMGVCLGVMLALALVAANIGNVSDMLARAAAPNQALIVLIGSFASTFGVGATVTGLIFEEVDRE
jgi:hypothetical protein